MTKIQEAKEAFFQQAGAAVCFVIDTYVHQ
jgi:hypothetical protein